MPPVLTYSDKALPLAVLAASGLASVELDVQPDAKASKDSPPALAFPSG